MRSRNRTWFGRNRLWFIPLLILFVFAVGGAGAYWSLFLRITRSAACRTAMQAIREDKGMQAALGEPIHTVKWPSRATAPSESEDGIYWSIYGPKGVARAHAKTREAAGETQIVSLDVKLPDGKKVLLDVAGENDAPPADFSNHKAPTNRPEANAPPPEINLPVPPSDEPGK
jgi:hypothetical protein